jgi:mediator of RNA polymerase II transcription subunit 14
MKNLQLLYRYKMLKLLSASQVYQQSQGSLKISKSILHGSDLMVMGFPHCANAYYLLMQLDKDFKPIFHLLETQCDTSDKANTNADAKEAIRFNKIDVGHIEILKNDCSTIPFDVKLHALQGIANCADIIENGIPVQNGFEPLPLLPACSPSFSSIVDKVFEYEDGLAAKQNQSVPPSSFSSTSHLSSLSAGFHGVDARAVSVSPMHDGGLSRTQSSSNNYLPNSLRHLQSNKTFSHSSPVRNSSVTKFLGPESTQDPSSLRSPSDHSVVDGSKSLQLVPSMNNNSNQIPGESFYSASLGNSLPGHLVGPSTTAGGSLPNTVHFDTRLHFFK